MQELVIIYANVTYGLIKFIGQASEGTSCINSLNSGGFRRPGPSVVKLFSNCLVVTDQIYCNTEHRMMMMIFYIYFGCINKMLVAMTSSVARNKSIVVL